MDVLAAIFSVIIIIMLVSLRTSMNDRIYDLEKQIDSLKNLLDKALSDKKQVPQVPKSAVSDTNTPEWQAGVVKPAPEAVKEPQPEIPKPKIVDQPVRTSQHIDSTEKRVVIDPPKWTPPPPPEPRPSFFERYPDLEKFIGENLINKIGIAILVLAIGYFVKYAIDANWIGPVGRVAIGFICGGILVAVAHRMRNSYQAFSSVLIGGGIAVFYFSATLGYHQFTPPVFGQTTAFIIMVVITAFAVALSLLYDRQELAIIALIGGLASPFMVSNGTANYQALFIYLLVLNLGLLIIAYNKAWRLLNFLAFVLSQLIYVSVLFTVDAKGAGVTMLYGGLFYLLYFAINIANNIKEGKKFIASDFGILLSNTAIYFAAGLYLLTYMDLPQYRGLFSASMGVLNLAASYLLLRNKKVDTNILYLLIGITITFISLTAPIQLHGNNITLFWASEAVLLYWLYQKSGIALMRYTALGIWVIMLGSLAMDVNDFYYGYTSYDKSAYPHIATIIANKGFITMAYAALATYLLAFLVGRDDTKKSMGFRINKIIISTIALSLLFLSGLLEINYQFSSRYPEAELNILYSVFYTCAFVLVLDVVTTKLQKSFIGNKARFMLIGTAIAIYLVVINNAFNVQSYILTKNTLGTHFITHWLNALIIGVLFVRFINLCRSQFTNAHQPLSWLISTAIILFLSLEINLVANAMFYSPKHSLDSILETYIQTGLPVLWGLYSFALMWLGMRYKYKPLRIISLSMFSVTLLKLFIFDLRNIPVAGKIVAFFCLGVLLLIISFMYQKVKKIIVDNEDKPAE